MFLIIGSLFKTKKKIFQEELMVDTQTVPYGEVVINVRIAAA